jgi:hypothetical protein
MSPDEPLSIRSLPAGAGLAWLTKSLALVRAQPARLLFLAVLMQAVLGLSQVPLLGILIILAVPGLSAGLLQAFHMVEAGQRPPLPVLFAALATRPRAGRLLALGALMFAAGVLSVSLVLGIDGGALDPDLMARLEQGDLDALAALDPAFLLRMGMALAVVVTVTGVLSFLTIPLIWFSGMRVGAALLAGLRAMWLNWKPFLVLGLGLGALLIPVMLVFGMLVRATGASAAGSLLVLALVLLVLLLFQLAVFGTQYCAHQAIFGGTKPVVPAADAGGDDGQLVA